jgi:branched-chain amino acid transport system substrate-binding protein
LAIAALAIAAGAGAFAWRERAARAPHAAASASTASGIARAPTCATNAECVRAHGGEAWRCHGERHECVEIASPDCTVHEEPHDAEAEDVVWIGGMYPLDEPGFESEARAVELARQDFAKALGSSAARTGSLHARPIGVVMCNEAADAPRAARHLVEDVEVPAILGFRDTLSAQTAIPAELMPHRVLAVVTISQAPTLTRIPTPPGEPHLVWRTTLNRDDAVPPLTHLISDVLEPAARTGPRGIGARAFKVATLWMKTANHDGGEAYFTHLRFNGKSALENGSNFRQVVLEGDDAAALDEVVRTLLAFQPNVVVSDIAYTKVLSKLEERWPAGPRPVYLTEDGFAETVTAFVGTDPTRRRRFFATTNLSTTMTNARLVLRYNMAFPREPIARSEAPQPSYDGLYLLAYATYALGDGAISGPALARSIERLLPPGRPVDVGPDAIYDAFATLRAGQRIDLAGAIGPLDFDPTTGEAPVPYSILCLGVDDRGAATTAIDSGLVYESKSGRLVGKLSCP